MEGVSPEAQKITVDRDEGVRGVIDEQKMASLKPAFPSEGKGVVTAANSSQISDGASAVLVANAEVAKADGFKREARFRARVVVGSDPTMQLTGVIPATQMALEKAGLTMQDIDWIEINEAFAAVVLSWARELRGRSGQGQSLGRRDRARTSAGRDRRRADVEDARRAGSDRRSVRAAGDVHRPRPGDGDDHRAGVSGTDAGE